MNLKEEILKLKSKNSLYDIALDIGISESSLYNFMNFDNVGEKVINKIVKYFEESYEKNKHGLKRNTQIGNKYICLANNKKVTLKEKYKDGYAICYTLIDEFGNEFNVGKHVLERDFKVLEED